MSMSLVKSGDLIPGKLYMVTAWMNSRSSTTHKPGPSIGTVLLCTRATTEDSFVNFNGIEVFTKSKLVYFLIGLNEHSFIVSNDAVFEEMS